MFPVVADMKFLQEFQLGGIELARVRHDAGNVELRGKRKEEG